MSQSCYAKLTFHKLTDFFFLLCLSSHFLRLLGFGYLSTGSAEGTDEYDSLIRPLTWRRKQNLFHKNVVWKEAAMMDSVQNYSQKIFMHRRLKSSILVASETIYLR